MAKMMQYIKHLAYLFLIFLLVFILSCTPVQEAAQTPVKTETVIDVAKEEGAQKVIEEKPKKEISAEVKELLNKHKTKVSSIYYKYRGPETGNYFHEFYIKGNKMKYKPARELKSLDQQDSFDSVFIDKTTKTAYSYCEDATCRYKGKKADLSYESAYIQTAFDWINVIDAVKVGEEMIDRRATWKLQTDKGILWVDTFYGVPLKAESNGRIYKFEQISVDSIQDADVMPQ